MEDERKKGSEPGFALADSTRNISPAPSQSTLVRIGVEMLTNSFSCNVTMSKSVSQTFESAASPDERRTHLEVPPEQAGGLISGLGERSTLLQTHPQVRPVALLH